MEFKDQEHDEFEDQYNNAYAHSKRNSWKLIKAMFDMFGSLSPHNDQAESQENQDSMQNKTEY